jgi:hypothetical protein
MGVVGKSGEKGNPCICRSCKKETISSWEMVVHKCDNCRSHITICYDCIRLLPYDELSRCKGCVRADKLIEIGI